MKHLFLSGVEAGEYYLKELLENKANIKAILTKRNNKACDKGNFEKISNKYSIPIYYINNINDEESINLLRRLESDIMWVLGWSQILKKEVLGIPKVGCIGSHPTKLPKYRGRAPIPWTILKGIKESAMTFFWLDEGTDTGDILAQKEFKIGQDDTSTDLYYRIIEKGKEIIKESLPLIESGNPPRIKQNEEEFIESWPKRTPKEGFIDWNKPTQNIYALIRATARPYPGAFTFYRGERVIFWKASRFDKIYGEEPGTLEKIINNDFVVACKDGSLIIKEVQPEEDISMVPKDYIKKYNIPLGDKFD
jgi:methionyl-tRNA formyltransferase